METKTNRFLAVYSGLLTAVFAVTVFTGAASPGRNTFEEIDVQRINVREADGTLRMVVSNNARAPGVYIRGTERPHPNEGSRGAGMWFFNEEGTENGGLTSKGRTLPDGKTYGSLQLSFDQYEQDQTLTLRHEEYDGRQATGLRINDYPPGSIVELLDEVDRALALPQAERDARVAELQEEHGAIGRLFAGRDEHQAALLDLRDATGRTRLRLQVAADGSAGIEFLDEDGEVQGTLTPESLAALR